MIAPTLYTDQPPPCRSLLKTESSKPNGLPRLASPPRIAIIRLLATGQMTVTDLAKGCRTEIVNVSHHLGVMRGAGLVEADRDGRFMRYSLLASRRLRSEVELTHASGA